MGQPGGCCCIIGEIFFLWIMQYKIQSVEYLCCAPCPGFPCSLSIWQYLQSKILFQSVNNIAANSLDCNPIKSLSIWIISAGVNWAAGIIGMTDTQRPESRSLANSSKLCWGVRSPWNGIWGPYSSLTTWCWASRCLFWDDSAWHGSLLTKSH